MPYRFDGMVDILLIIMQTGCVAYKQ